MCIGYKTIECAHGDIMLREAKRYDAADILRIYQEGIDTGSATFAETAPSWRDWDEAHFPHSRFVATIEDRVAGWAALSPTSPRAVYGGVGEVSIYTAGCARGRGVGHALLGALTTASEAAGIWTLQAVIFPENRASIALHEAFDFRRVGMRERIGLMTYGPHAGRWRDTVLLERRSNIAGIG